MQSNLDAFHERGEKNCRKSKWVTLKQSNTATASGKTSTRVKPSSLDSREVLERMKTGPEVQVHDVRRALISELEVEEEVLGDLIREEGDERFSSLNSTTRDDFVFPSVITSFDWDSDVLLSRGHLFGF